MWLGNHLLWMKLDSFIQIDIPIKNSIHRGLFPISNDIIPILDIKCWIFHCHVSDCQRVYRQKWPCRKRMTHWMEWGSLFSEPRLSSSKRHWRPTANEGSTEPVGKASLQSPCGPTWAHMPSKVTQAHSQYMSISNPQHPPLNYLDIYPLPESQGSHSLLSASLRFCDCWQAKRPIWLRRHDLQRIQNILTAACFPAHRWSDTGDQTCSGSQ